MWCDPGRASTQAVGYVPQRMPGGGNHVDYHMKIMWQLHAESWLPHGTGWHSPGHIAPHHRSTTSWASHAPQPWRRAPEVMQGWMQWRACHATFIFNDLSKEAIDGFHGTFYHGNWRELHHHAACWLVNIHITWPFALQLP